MNHHIFSYEPPYILLWTTISPPMNHQISSYEPPYLLLWTTISPPMNHHIFSYEPPYLQYSYEPPHIFLWTTRSPPMNQHISIYEPPDLLLWAISTYEPPHIRLLISLLPISNFFLNHKSESESEMSTWKPQPGISDFLIWKHYKAFGNIIKKQFMKGKLLEIVNSS